MYKRTFYSSACPLKGMAKPHRCISCEHFDYEGTLALIKQVVPNVFLCKEATKTEAIVKAGQSED